MIVTTSIRHPGVNRRRIKENDPPGPLLLKSVKKLVGIANVQTTRLHPGVNKRRIKGNVPGLIMLTSVKKLVGIANV